MATRYPIAIPNRTSTATPTSSYVTTSWALAFEPPVEATVGGVPERSTATTPKVTAATTTIASAARTDPRGRRRTLAIGRRASGKLSVLSVGPRRGERPGLLGGR